MSALNCALANDLVAIDARLRSLSPNNSGNEVKVARYRCISACNFCLRTHRASLESPSKELSESGTKQHVVNTIKSAVDHCHHTVVGMQAKVQQMKLFVLITLSR